MKPIHASGWFVSRQRSGAPGEVGVEQVEDHPGPAPLEHPQRLALGRARRLQPRQVGLGGWLDPQLGDGDAMQRRIQLAVPTRDRQWRCQAPE